MFDPEIMQYLNFEFITGFIGGAIFTSALAWGLNSFVLDKIIKRALKAWEKMTCAFLAAFIIILLWGLARDGIVWNAVPAMIIIYGLSSDFIWDNVIQRIWKKKA
jgi:hypothetical protein